MEKVIIAFIILYITLPMAFADFIIFPAKQKNAAKSWSVSIGKNAQGKKGSATITKSDTAIVLKTGNTGRCFFTVKVPAEGAWRNKKYNAIEVEYKCKGGFDKVELWPYVYDRINLKTYRYAVYVKDSAGLKKQKFNRFWKRSSSPKLRYSSLKNITFAIYKNTEMSISKITLLEGQRKLYLEDKSGSAKSVLNSTNVELQIDDKSGTYFFWIKNKKIGQHPLMLEIADTPKGPWAKYTLTKPVSQGHWVLAFNLKKESKRKIFSASAYG